MSYKYALVPYIRTPEKYSSVVLFHDENVSIIYDAFPKSKVHLLILPRDESMSKKRPQEAFKDSKVRKLLEGYVQQGIELARKAFDKEWKRIDGDDEKRMDIIVCCHAVPSLNNLHIHVLTADMCGRNMKNRKHYNSFNTKFAIHFDEFPLQEEDFRLNDAKKCELLLKQDLIYNGVNYKSSFKKMQLQIQDDFHKIYKHI